MLEAVLLIAAFGVGVLISAPILHLLFHYWPMPVHRDRAAEAADQIPKIEEV